MARFNKPGKETSQASGWGAQLSGSARRLAEQPIGSLTTHRMKTLTVIVSIDLVDTRDFSDRVYGEIAARVHLNGGEMPVTNEEFVKYFITALKTRVSWVNRGLPGSNFGIRVDDAWALPVPMAQVVSAIGIIDSGPGTRYVPAWNEESDEFVLSRVEWEDVTRRLLALESLPGVDFIHALEKDISGVERVMCLMLGAEDGEEYFYADVPIHALEALVAMIAGLRPQAYVDVAVLPPQLIPVYRVGKTWVAGFMHELATSGYAG